MSNNNKWLGFVFFATLSACGRARDVTDTISHSSGGQISSASNGSVDDGGEGGSSPQHPETGGSSGSNTETTVGEAGASGEAAECTIEISRGESNPGKQLDLEVPTIESIADLIGVEPIESYFNINGAADNFSNFCQAATVAVAVIKGCREFAMEQIPNFGGWRFTDDFVVPDDIRETCAGAEEVTTWKECLDPNLWGECHNGIRGYQPPGCPEDWISFEHWCSTNPGAHTECADMAESTMSGVALVDWLWSGPAMCEGF